MKMNWKVVMAIAAVFLIMTEFAFLFRWQLITASSQNSIVAYQLDRWTGNVYWMRNMGPKQPVQSTE